MKRKNKLSRINKFLIYLFLIFTYIGIGYCSWNISINISGEINTSDIDITYIDCNVYNYTISPERKKIMITVEKSDPVNPIIINMINKSSFDIKFDSTQSENNDSYQLTCENPVFKKDDINNIQLLLNSDKIDSNFIRIPIKFLLDKSNWSEDLEILLEISD